MTTDHGSLDTQARRPITQRYIAVGLCGVLVVAGSTLFWFWRQPSPAQLLQQAGQVMRRDPARAEQLVRRALSARGGRDPDAQIVLCQLLVRRRAWVDASALFATVDLQACRPDLLLAVGRDALEHDRRTMAHQALTALGERDVPEAITALELLRNDYQEWGDTEQTLAAARELTRRQPQNSVHWATLIQLLIQTGNDLECVQAIRAAQATDLPKNDRSESQNALVLRLINLGDIPQLRIELAKQRAAEGDSVRVQGHQVYLHRLEGQPVLAFAAISKLISQLSSGGSIPPYAYFTRGIIELDLRHFTDAMEDLKRTVAIEPFNAAAHFKLSEAYRGLRQDARALEHRQIATGIVERQKRIAELMKRRVTEPLNEKLYLELAQLHDELGDRDAARRWQQWSVRVQQSEGD